MAEATRSQDSLILTYLKISTSCLELTECYSLNTQSRESSINFPVTTSLTNSQMSTNNNQYVYASASSIYYLDCYLQG